MKKNIILIFLCIVLIGTCLVGCEKSTQINAVSFSEITAAGSKNYAVRVSYSSDKKLEGKGKDVQIKFSKLGKITIWNEGEEKIEYEIKDYDEWYSLTKIFADAKEETKDKEKYEKYEDALTKFYLLNYKGDIKVTLRAVVGDIEDNKDKSGQILVGTDRVSDNFTLKIK